MIDTMERLPYDRPIERKSNYEADDRNIIVLIPDIG